MKQITDKTGPALWALQSGTLTVEEASAFTTNYPLTPRDVHKQIVDLQSKELTAEEVTRFKLQTQIKAYNTGELTIEEALLFKAEAQLDTLYMNLSREAKAVSVKEILPITSPLQQSAFFLGADPKEALQIKTQDSFNYFVSKNMQECGTAAKCSNNNLHDETNISTIGDSSSYSDFNATE
jgi:hypothetical protein